MTPMTGESLPVPEQAQLRFGDQGEFTYDQCIETFDASGTRLIEVVIFFWQGDLLRGITVMTPEADALDQSESESDVVPPVEIPVIDPESVLEILQLPSAELLNISRPIDQDAA
jgi:hypothetical protein